MRSKSSNLESWEPSRHLLIDRETKLGLCKPLMPIKQLPDSMYKFRLHCTLLKHSPLIHKCKEQVSSMYYTHVGIRSGKTFVISAWFICLWFI